MMLAATAWALFKLIRIFIFSLSTIVSMAWTTLYIVLLIHNWGSFMAIQRAVVLILISVYGISSIVLYLMIVVLFRPWMDGARAAILILFQAGGTAAFFLLRPSLPCRNISPEFTCKTIEDVLIVGGWSLSGLLLFYAFFLAIMSFIPVPAPPANPEAALAISLANEKSSEKEKRLSTFSVGSRYSQLSFVGPRSPSSVGHSQGPTVISSSRMGPNYYRPGTPSSVRSIVPSILYPTDGTRAPSITSSRRAGYKYDNRPGTPGSIRSMSSSTSSTRSLTNPRYNYIVPSRVSSPASSIRSTSSPNTQLPNEPISRQGTPLSVVSYQGPLVADSLHDQRYPRSMTPLGLTPGVREPVSRQGTPILRQGTPLSVLSYQDSIVTYDQPHPRSMTPLGLTPGVRESVSRQGTPFSVASDQSLTPPGLMPGVRGRNTPQSLASLTYSPNVRAPPLAQPAPAPLRSIPPGSRPPLSRGSSRQNGNLNVPSVPRSPSPQNLFFNAPIPATPISAVLPAHPGLPKHPYYGRRVNEVRRYGSVPDIRTNDTPSYVNSHHRAASDYPGATMSNRGNNGQDSSIQRRRQDD